MQDTFVYVKPITLMSVKSLTLDIDLGLGFQWNLIHFQNRSEIKCICTSNFFL